jgi:hypothetical protein
MADRTIFDSPAEKGASRAIFEHASGTRALDGLRHVVRGHVDPCRGNDSCAAARPALFLWCSFSPIQSGISICSGLPSYFSAKFNLNLSLRGLPLIILGSVSALGNIGEASCRTLPSSGTFA